MLPYFLQTVHDAHQAVFWLWTKNHQETNPTDKTNMDTPNPQNTSEQSQALESKGAVISVGKTQVANLCAIGIGISFFMPWINLLFVRPSGFDIQGASNDGKILWLMPCFCLLTLFAGLTGKSQQVAGQLAGASPFLLLVGGIYQNGSDILKALEPGAWLALGLGAVLFIVARR
jgi:hypothetical protein